MKTDSYTKIVATIGPASSDYKTIKALFKAGVDVFRLNFSHGTHEDHAERHAIIRQIEQEEGRPIGILADMQGPKLRIGTFANGKENLKKGQRIELHLEKFVGDITKVTLPHKEIFAAIKPGEDLLINDGRLRLQGRAEHRQGDYGQGHECRRHFRPQGRQCSRHDFADQHPDEKGPRRSGIRPRSWC